MKGGEEGEKIRSITYVMYRRRFRTMGAIDHYIHQKGTNKINLKKTLYFHIANLALTRSFSGSLLLSVHLADHLTVLFRGGEAPGS